MSEDPTGTDPRILAVLEQILAVQTDLLTLIRENGESALAISNESVAIQRQSAERQAIALATQRKIARLYRGVVTVFGIIVVGAIAFLAYVTLRG
jgi:hypothetical protein